VPTDERTPKFFQTRRSGRAQTLAELLIAIALLSIIVVFITGDLTNITQADAAGDRSIEISAANFLLGVMKSDPTFWSNGNDWGSGSGDQCYNGLGPYDDPGPSDPTRWRTIPLAPPAVPCAPLPFTDPGAPQQGQPSNGSGPVGDIVQYQWSAQEHNNDPDQADLTVWVRRDAGSPVFEYHSIRYTSPGTSGLGSGGHHHGGGGGGGGGGGNPSPEPPGPRGV
jgi:hypothetical protein